MKDPLSKCFLKLAFKNFLFSFNLKLIFKNKFRKHGQWVHIFILFYFYKPVKTTHMYSLKIVFLFTLFLKIVFG